ncbi:TonB-dependent receptor [Arachidicoccus ginsenosidimutans]|uniref:TonB-dependent receptor n=1 Tax=Arachidicoccus sp. BS20 TaxID=1850526 RepID=UPI0007F05203|nr:TonB-dependent receptor [Arachidicoccus sp. BS20]ANI90346.1 TonB-dependent receptor [Arachidicoccus sp. BS20]
MEKRYFIRLFILTSLFTVFFESSFAYHITTDSGFLVKGKIIATDGHIVEGASVRLKEIARHTLSNASGYFELKNVPAGDYQLLVSAIGYANYSQKLFVHANCDTLIISLKSSDAQLSDVTILSGINKFNKKETDDVARLPLKNIENPQVYSVIPKEIITEQMATDYNSIFKNVPGAGVPVVYNQGRSAMLSRGFTTANLIRNSISGFVYTNVDPANLEVLEAIKGPSGTLFNSSQISFGGLFNRVTKKPFDGERTELSYTGGGNSLSRITFDINHPLDSDKNVLFRMNGALHTEQSFQDFGFTKSVMLAPSFVYKVNDKLTFLLDVEASMFNATSPIRFAPSGSIHNIKDLGMDYKKSFSNNSLDYTTQQLNVYGQINYKLSDKWKLQTNLTRTYSATKGYVTQLSGKSDSTLQQSVQKEDFPYNGVEIQQNIIGDFKIGSFRNRIVAGIDYYNQRSDRNTPTITMPVINFRHPGKAYYNFNADVVDSLAPYATKYDVYRTNQFTYSAYVSDVLNITDRLNVMLSLRGDHFVDKGTYYPANDSTKGAYHQNALSPKLGVVYELVKDKLSLFGNYMNGFDNQTGTDYNGNTFKPEQANQWEIGFKADAFNHRLSSTISYYHISVSNMTRDDIEHPGYDIQDGTQLSRGMEAEVIANPFGGLNIVAGYTYNDSKFTRSDSSVLGLRPATAGPSNLANLWLSYRFLTGSVRGLGFGVGGNYGSSSFQTNTKTFVFTIPSYTTLDATLFYDASKWRIGLKVDNLTNEHYWSFRLAPQMLRRFSANFTFRF